MTHTAVVTHHGAAACLAHLFSAQFLNKETVPYCQTAQERNLELPGQSNTQKETNILCIHGRVQMMEVRLGRAAKQRV